MCIRNFFRLIKFTRTFFIFGGILFIWFFLLNTQVQALCGILTGSDCYIVASGTLLEPPFVECGEVYGNTVCCQETAQCPHGCVNSQCVPGCPDGSSCYTQGLASCLASGCQPTPTPIPSPTVGPGTPTPSLPSCPGVNCYIGQCPSPWVPDPGYSCNTPSEVCCIQQQVAGCGVVDDQGDCVGVSGVINPSYACGVDYVNPETEICCSSQGECPSLDPGDNYDVCPNYANGTGVYTIGSGCIDIITSFPICPAVYCGVQGLNHTCAWPPELCAGYTPPTSDAECGRISGVDCIDANGASIGIHAVDCTDLNCDPNDWDCRRERVDGTECCIIYPACSNYSISLWRPKLFCNEDGDPTSSSATGLLYTAVGCIPMINDADTFFSTQFSVFWLRIGLSMAGGLALLIIAVSGILIKISVGNPQKIKYAQELMLGAIAALILVIFSAYLLRVVGISILGIPGLQ
ncbi:hypothetical protein IPM62_00490 [Candidatus Woesebacteria bacterium]|nr:MAG: hypothetical protein IPM62_00490 [Candidatus Woesebacteria bacterium]